MSNTCPYVFLTTAKRGQQCGKRLKDHQDFCWQHRNVIKKLEQKKAQKKKPEPEPKQEEPQEESSLKQVEEVPQEPPQEEPTKKNEKFIQLTNTKPRRKIIVESSDSDIDTTTSSSDSDSSSSENYLKYTKIGKKKDFSSESE